MPHAGRDRPASRPRRANVPLPETLLREAREMGIDPSQVCEHGLAAAVTEARRQRWLEENHQAMEAWNDYVVEHGLPFAAYRQL